jgi:glycosyltransferase involved in cell wall biosynthesis
MTAPRVSVVMSVYNGQRHLRGAIDSILQQTYRDFEFIIVNDGSSDATAEILQEFESRDSRVRIIDQPNAGLTVALRSGCGAATGEFIARQDADDWSDPLRLEKLVKLIDVQTGAVMVSSWATYVDDDGEFVELVERCADPDDATRKLLYERSGPPAHGTVMIRRHAYEQVGGYRTCFYFGQDSDLWLRLGMVGKIAFVQESLYQWRMSVNGISGANSDTQLQFGELGQLCHSARLRGESDEALVTEAEQLRQAFLSQRSNRSTMRRQQAAAHYRIGTGLSRRGNRRARWHFWSAVRLDPFHWRSWCRLGAALLLLR